jgi:hypothetical protein
MRQRIRDGFPRGFKSSTEVKAVATAFETQMIAAGNPYARLAIRGSAVTNRSYDSETGKYTGHPFDRGKTKSDFDFAIVDGVLFNKAIKANVPISPAGTRTKELRGGDLERLGLKTMNESVQKLVGTRPYSFVIYGSEKAIVDRGPVMWLSGARK